MSEPAAWRTWSPPPSGDDAVAGPTRSALLPSLVVFAVVLTVHLGVVGFMRNFGWDDGAITLAFARTLATSGRIALTPVSETVEGFSSPVWFALMAAVHRIGQPGFDAFVRASQVLAGLCAALSAVLLFRLTAKPSRPWPAAMLCAAVFVSAPFVNETMNGMEMTLLGLLGLMLVVVVERPSSAATTSAAVVAALIVATRSEAILYVVPVAIVFFFRGDRRAALAMAAGASVGWVTVTIWRVIVFGQVLPNTIVAKRWEPYRIRGVIPQLQARTEAFTELFAVYAPVIVLILFLAAMTGRRHVDELQKSKAFWLTCAYVSAVVVFNAAVGKNWGYTGRMELSAIPLLFLVLMRMLQSSRLDGLLVQAVVAVSLVVGAVPYLQWSNIWTARSTAVAGTTDYGITPATYRATGEAIDSVRRMLGLEVISFLVPDVGGSALCCERIRFLDLGLLANPSLAASGFSSFPTYLEERKPDVIETHQPWSEVSNIYASRFFLDTYSPVVYRRMWLYLRNDHLATLEARGLLRSTDSGPSGPSGLRHRGAAFDEQFIDSGRLPHRVLIETS